MRAPSGGPSTPSNGNPGSGRGRRARSWPMTRASRRRSAGGTRTPTAGRFRTSRGPRFTASGNGSTASGRPRAGNVPSRRASRRSTRWPRRWVCRGTCERMPRSCIGGRRRRTSSGDAQSTRWSRRRCTPRAGSPACRGRSTKSPRSRAWTANRSDGRIEPWSANSDSSCSRRVLGITSPDSAIGSSSTWTFSGRRRRSSTRSRRTNSRPVSRRAAWRPQRSTFPLAWATSRARSKRTQRWPAGRGPQPVPDNSATAPRAATTGGGPAALVGEKAGETTAVLIPPEKGAGVRDPRLVELRTEREFLRQEISPEVGLEVSISGKHGVVTAVSAGRVRVDFNNPLAGKTLKYVVKATRKAKTPEERVRAIIDMDYGLADQFKIDLKGGSAEIHLPDVCKTDEKWFVSKFRVVADLRELSELKAIRFVEEYEKKEPKAEPITKPKPVEAKPEAAADTPPPKKPRKKATATKAKANAEPT